jgi:hypothetical protein
VTLANHRPVLSMIVRNEELTLPRLATSVIEHIGAWVIIDTGSTDRTKDTACEVFASRPGQLLELEWTGFADARNAALGAARAMGEWIFTIDADEVLVGDLQLLPDAGCDGLDVEVRSGSLRYWLPRLIRGSVPWTWNGRTHEHLAIRGRTANTQRLSGAHIVHHGDGGARADKYTRDLSLLHQDWRDNPGDPRTAFYLARTYDELQQWPEAIKWYDLRVHLGGWDEEVWYAAWRRGAAALANGQTALGISALEAAWRSRPWRAEPLVALAEHFRVTGHWRNAWSACTAAFAHTSALPYGKGAAPTHDVLFVDVAALEWQVAYEASIAAWYVGQPQQGRRLTSYLLSRTDLPEVVREAASRNLAYYQSNK